MVKMIMHGCNGRMGQMITSIVAADSDIEIVAGIDPFGGQKNDYPVFESLDKCDVKADVLVDFVGAHAVDNLINWCVENEMPCVLCSTGLSEKQLEDVKVAAGKVAMLRSANMSLGVNTLMKVLTQVAPIFAEAGFDIEIVEKHHNQKLDAPSGTAIALADSINEVFDNNKPYQYGRTPSDGKRRNEIGIHGVRGGTVVGEHEVGFYGDDEIITVSHSARSRKIFANGALKAAQYIADKPAGMYNMEMMV